MYSHHSSLVEHQLPVIGGAGSSPDQNNILKLRLLIHKMKTWACTWYLVAKLAGHLEKKNPANLNLNVPQNLLLGTRDDYHNSLQI
jgi:hypothetical protein